MKRATVFVMIIAPMSFSLPAEQDRYMFWGRTRVWREWLGGLGLQYEE